MAGFVIDAAPAAVDFVKGTLVSLPSRGRGKRAKGVRGKGSAPAAGSEISAGTAAPPRVSPPTPGVAESEPPPLSPPRRSPRSHDEAALKQACVWADPSEAAVQVDLVGTRRLKKLRTSESESLVSGPDYEARLRAQYQKIHPVPAWGEALEDPALANQNSPTDSLFSRVHGALDRSVRALQPDFLDVTRVKDANQMGPSNGVVQDMSWHPQGRILITGGFDRTLRLFQIDGKVNDKIQQVFFNDLPIAKCQFTVDGKEILLSGRRKHFYIYDVEAGQVSKVPEIKGFEEKAIEFISMSPCNTYIASIGRDGHIVILSRQTKQLLFTLKSTGHIVSMRWAHNGAHVWTFGQEGEVYCWDLGSRTCLSRWNDQGCVRGTCLDVSNDSSWIATGQNTGVVNIYPGPGVGSSPLPGPSPLDTRLLTSPAPAHTVMNLTTSITSLALNHDATLLCLASRHKKDSMRIVHVDSGSVYKNWPTPQTPLSYVNVVKFSPTGGYLAVGNDKGKALLWRLNHWTSPTNLNT